ncbi:MAG: hypothetical protein R2879_02220 [Saprospiraceae bacterium]
MEGILGKDIFVQSAIVPVCRDIDFIDSIYGFAGCSNNIFYKTSNGGETWELSEIEELILE